MAKKGVIALMACVFALCLALVGCGGGGAAATDNKAAFVGTWDLVEMSQDGQVTGADDLETLKSLGLEVYANFNEDGTMSLSLFGESKEGTWEASSTTAGTVEMEGEKVSMNIADEKLTFEQEGASLTFQKGEPKEAAGSSSDDESAAAEGEASESETAETTDEASESEAGEATDEASASEAAETTDETTDEASESEAGEADESSEATDEVSESSESSESGATDEAAESESSSSSAAA